MATKKSAPPFVHLHVHTEYSMLDGLNRIPQMIEKVKNSGMNAVAMTDHGVMYGVYEFWKFCNDASIKPIIGCEIYVAPKEKELRQEVDGIKYYHLVLLVKNKIGYHNLIKLVSESHLYGYYYRPRADRKLLEKYSEGLICTSACPQGPLGKHILRNEPAQAKEWLGFLHQTYGKDFYLELQRHGLVGSDRVDASSDEYLKEQSKINTQLKEWAKKYKIPLIATTDAHYLDEDDEFTQEVVFAIKDGKTLDDPTRRFAYKYTYIKTPEEMHETFADMPEVMQNTQKLADSVEKFDITYERVQPSYPGLPKGKTAQQELHDIVYEGVPRKYPRLTDELKERIDFELEIIHDKGYDDYFLVVADMMKWARSQDIIVGARGSVGGSVAAYCLDIINIDPIEWECYFERFLNPERKSPPDIDLDIQDNRRDEVIEYVSKKYGEKNVCAIAAFGRLKTRAGIRDVCRVMGINLNIADQLSKMIVVRYGKPDTIEKSMEKNLEFARIVASDSRLQEMVGVVSKIEGLSRHVSTHACGYLITPEPNVNYVPVQTETGKSNKVITQIEFMPLEDLGLMKFDFLGLANFSIISYTLDLIKKFKGKDIDIYQISPDDKKTFELFQRGDTTSVFQFESSGMKRYLKDLKPETLDDLCFMAAAYRPGPMEYIEPYIRRKLGKEKVEYLVPELEPITKNTYGIAIYQEQVIRIAVDLAGYTMGQADILRKGIGKKIKAVLESEKPKFIEGCKKNGFSQEVSEKLWEYLLPFADYGFNKAHAATYGVIGYWTAYLKAHYPLEFMCARLTADMDKPDKLVVALEEAKNLGLKLLPPDINKSHAEFAPESDDSIRYGLDGIKNVGSNIIEELVRSREEDVPFVSLDDFCIRVPLVNSRSLEALIKVGAMADFGEANALLSAFPGIMSKIAVDAKIRRAGQIDMFWSASTQSSTIRASTLPQVEAAPLAEKLHWERELLGIFFSSHPLTNYVENQDLPNFTDDGMKDGTDAHGVALVANMRKITTKNGDSMAFLTLEDMHTTVDAVLFPRDYKKYSGNLDKGDVIIVSGRWNKRNGEMSLIVNQITNLTKGEVIGSERKLTKNKKEITIRLKPGIRQNDLSQLRDLLVENPGNTRVVLHVLNNGKSQKFKVKKGVKEDIIFDVIAKLNLVEEITGN